MKLAIVTAVHGRPKITEAFTKSVKRIYETFGIHTFAAVTEDWDQYGDELIDPSFHLLTGEHMHVVKYKNKPVGEKFNQAVQLSKEHDWTHLMILGSDDIASNGLIEQTLTMGKYDMSGPDGLWFWGLNPRRAGFQDFGYFDLRGMIAGTGKVLSRRVIEACDYSPWPDACNYGMDGKLNKRIKNSFTVYNTPMVLGGYKPPQTGGFLLDVKHTHHISSMSPITRDRGMARVGKKEMWEQQDAYDVLYNHLPIDERDYLFRLHAEALEDINHRRAAIGQKPIEFRRG